MKFIADEMLGKLARWLRMSGIDVYYKNEISDKEILRLSREEKRIVLTRDRKLIKELSSDRRLLVEFDYLHDQTKQFYERFPNCLDEIDPLTRCAECNAALENVSKESIKDKVYPYVYQTHDNFTKCPNCDRIYWEGTHIKHIMNRLELLKPNK